MTPLSSSDTQVHPPPQQRPAFIGAFLVGMPLENVEDRCARRFILLFLEALCHMRRQLNVSIGHVVSPRVGPKGRTIS